MQRRSKVSKSSEANAMRALGVKDRRKLTKMKIAVLLLAAAFYIAFMIFFGREAGGMVVNKV